LGGFDAVPDADGGAGWRRCRRQSSIIIQGLTEGGFQPMGVVYMFDPATKAWTKKNPMPEPYVHHAMTASVNGKIDVFGGFSRPGKESCMAAGEQRLGIYAGHGCLASDRPPAEQARRPARGGWSTARFTWWAAPPCCRARSDPAIRFDGKPHDMCVRDERGIRPDDQHLECTRPDADRPQPLPWAPR